MKHLICKPLAALLGAQMLLTACSATAHAIAAPIWPEPQPPQWPAGSATPQVPNFQAPSATHCARPMQTRELPGRPEANNQRHDKDTARSERARPAAPRSDGAFASPSSAPATAPPPPAAPAPTATAKPEALREPLAIADTEAKSAARGSGVAAQSSSRSLASPPILPAPQQRPVDSPVTAGMVDDNANFSEYLAFRGRAQVAHRPRDISERYLLEVKDARGHSVADAEVAVQSSQGAAMWARTDSGGRAWLHPNAFDPAQATLYDVTVRKAGRQAHAVLQRGQKSALEVVLPMGSQVARAKLDLVFLIDATGSMADEISKLKMSLRSIAAEVARLPSQPDLCFGMVAYRDKGDAFLLRSHDLTNDLAAFQGVLNALQADGGGDYPEAMNEALHETVHNLSWRGSGATRLVVLLADAPPHLDYGGPYYDDDMLAALGKGIKIFSVGASGLDKQGEYIQRQIAQYTGGRFVFLTYAQAHNPAAGPGRETPHDVQNYGVQTLDKLIVRLVTEELARL